MTSNNNTQCFLATNSHTSELLYCQTRYWCRIINDQLWHATWWFQRSWRCRYGPPWSHSHSRNSSNLTHAAGHNSCTGQGAPAKTWRCSRRILAWWWNDAGAQSSHRRTKANSARICNVTLINQRIFINDCWQSCITDWQRIEIASSVTFLSCGLDNRFLKRIYVLNVTQELTLCQCKYVNTFNCFLLW